MSLIADPIAPTVIKQRYEQVAALLEAEIRSGALQPGDRLPSERDLAQRMGVSRATIREALGALQVAGLLETRQGAGSYVVETPSGEPMLALPADASPSSVLEARAIFEPAIASLAAKAKAVDPELDRLLEVMAESADSTDPEQRQRWSDADRDFHRQFAYATGNTVLSAIAEHVANLMDEPLWRRLRDDAIAVPGRTTLYLAEHQLIAAAVAEGDAVAAAGQAAEHIKRTRRFMALD
jgi:DNA-binding FadR family transcriptional regulator